MTSPSAPVGKAVVAEVRLWGERVGAVAEDPGAQVYFEYEPRFARSGLEISPRHLPLDRQGPITFPELRRLDAFLGLPGVLADALPDRFGNAVIAQHFARLGRPHDALSPVQRLLYVGTRALGALEFRPAVELPASRAAAEALEVARLVAEARQVVAGRADVAIPEIMQLGASAGGARPKAVILWNRATHEVRSGFANPLPGDEPWIIKFDGVGELDEPDFASRPYNRIELAYNRMARAAGIATPESELLEVEGLAHFVSRRFDRTGPDHREKLHLHSLGGLEHADFNQPGGFSYEQYLRSCRLLGLPAPAMEEAFRRAVFNILAVNQDDHVKNFAFLMTRMGEWSLAPAYDLTFARGQGFTRAHQMTLAGKRDGFSRDDLLALGARADLRGDGAELIGQVAEVLGRWPEFAAAAGVPDDRVAAIAKELVQRSAASR